MEKWGILNCEVKRVKRESQAREQFEKQKTFGEMWISELLVKKRNSSEETI